RPIPSAPRSRQRQSTRRGIRRRRRTTTQTRSGTRSRACSNDRQERVRPRRQRLAAERQLEAGLACGVVRADSRDRGGDDVFRPALGFQRPPFPSPVGGGGRIACNAMRVGEILSARRLCITKTPPPPPPQAGEEAQHRSGCISPYVNNAAAVR